MSSDSKNTILAISSFSPPMSDNISLHVTLSEGLSNAEQIVSITREALYSILSKEKLVNFILVDIFHKSIALNAEFVDACQVERKSKKSKKFVPLVNKNDFKELLRSLKVKNHVKLVVHIPNERVSENPVLEALDQVKKMIGDLLNSELWDALKSLAANYKSTMNPDESGDSTPDFVFEKCKSRSIRNIHNGVVCDNCHPGETFETLEGCRYKCMVCKDFDLCERCFLSEVIHEDHVPEHPMIAIKDSRKYRNIFHENVGLFVELPCKSEERDLILDMLIENCSDEHRALLRQASPTGSVHEFMSNLAQIIQRANKFTELESVLGEEGQLDIETVKQVLCGETDLNYDLEVAREDGHDANNNELKVEIVVAPKGKSLSQIIMTNKSDQTIECENLNLEIVNCFGKVVASVSLQSKHDILPNRTGKFNVPVNNTHFKYPFKIVISNGESSSSCELSLKQLCGEIWLKHPEKATASESESIDTSKRKPDEVAVIPMAASSHSMLVPSLPKELLEIEEPSSETQCEDFESEDDYDMISIGDVEGDEAIPSDFEVLSPSNSAHDTE